MRLVKMPQDGGGLSILPLPALSTCSSLACFFFVLRIQSGEMGSVARYQLLFLVDVCCH